MPEASYESLKCMYVVRYLICEEGVLALASLPVLLPVLSVPAVLLVSPVSVVPPALPVLPVPPVLSFLPVPPVCLSEEGGGGEDPSFSRTASSPAKQEINFNFIH